MIEADNHEFLELLGDLYGAHGQNLKAHIAGGVWKGLKRMTLGEFRAVVEASIERLQHRERGVSHPPTVAEMWDLHRELKRGSSAAQPTAPSAPKYTGDHWAVAGNLLLLKHITRRDKPDDLDYAPDSYIPSLGPPVRHGEHTEAIAKILTRWMNAWVVDVREAEEERREFDRRKAWVDCMAEADRQVGEYLARYVRREAA
jgi:hypothetical protein